MLRSAALPFTIRRSEDTIDGLEIKSTVERLHGLLRLNGDVLVVQWSTAREVSRVGLHIRVDRDLGPVREAVLPLTAISGARLRRSWLRWPPGMALVLTAADLRAFEALHGEAGVPGLVLEHPAEVVLELRRSDHQLAVQFVSELGLAISEVLLELSERETAGLIGEGADDAGYRLPGRTGALDLGDVHEEREPSPVAGVRSRSSS